MAQRQLAQLNKNNFESTAIKSITESMSSSQSSILSKIVGDSGISSSPLFGSPGPSPFPMSTPPSPFPLTLSQQPPPTISGFPLSLNQTSLTNSIPLLPNINATSQMPSSPYPTSLYQSPVPQLSPMPFQLGQSQANQSNGSRQSEIPATPAAAITNASSFFFKNPGLQQQQQQQKQQPFLLANNFPSTSTMTSNTSAPSSLITSPLQNRTIDFEADKAVALSAQIEQVAIFCKDHIVLDSSKLKGCSNIMKEFNNQTEMLFKNNDDVIKSIIQPQ
jgi:hypothetical protein